MKIEKEMKELRIKNMKNDNSSSSKTENLKNGSLSTTQNNDNITGGTFVSKFRLLSW